MPRPYRKQAERPPVAKERRPSPTKAGEDRDDLRYAACTIPAQEVDMAAIEEELLDLERRYWQAIKDRDYETMARLTDNSCVLLGPRGVNVVEKSRIEDIMRAQPSSLRSFELKTGAKARMLATNAAVLAYDIHEELDVDGKPVSIDASDSSVWVRRDGQWLCAVHTESLSGDPYGRDRARG